jgi:predicted PurR-regulated permease PerM
VFPADPHEPRLLTWVRNPDVRRTLILGFLWLVILGLLIRFRGVLLPFGLAVLLAFILEPVVERLGRVRVRGRPVPRSAAIISCFVVLGAVGGTFATWALAQIARELAKLGAVTARVVADLRVLAGNLLDGLERFAADAAIPFDRREVEAVLEAHLIEAANELPSSATSLLQIGTDVVGSTFQTVFGLFLVLMLTAFLSIDRHRIEDFFDSMVPTEAHPGYQTIRAGTRVGLAGVVRGQVMICLVNGALTYLGLWLFDVKLPLILATLAAIFSLIPIFGSILSTIPIVAMALTDSFGKGVLTLLWIIGIHLVEANFLNPKIMGDAARIHPVLVVFALMVGERTSGLIGALFAVPIAAVSLTVFEFLHARALNVGPASSSSGPEETDPS